MFCLFLSLQWFKDLFAKNNMNLTAKSAKILRKARLELLHKKFIKTKSSQSFVKKLCELCGKKSLL